MATSVRLGKSRRASGEGGDTRTAILDAALSAFNDFGLRRTTMEDIARRAQVARMTVYRHFATKEDLIAALMLREANRFFCALDEQLDRHDSPVERAAEGFAFAVDYLRRHALLNRLLATEPEALLPYLTTEARPILEAGRTFISARLEADGVTSKGRTAEAAEILARLALSFVLTPQTVVSDVRHFARRYLSPLLLEQLKEVDGRGRARTRA